MAITQSSYTLGPVEICGRRWATERHTDGTGKVHIREYLSADDEVDRDAVLAARAAAITAELADTEADGVLNGT